MSSEDSPAMFGDGGGNSTDNLFGSPVDSDMFGAPTEIPPAVVEEKEVEEEDDDNVDDALFL